MSKRQDKAQDKAQDAGETGPETAQDGPQDVPTVADLLADGETVNAGTLAAMIGDKVGTHRWALGRPTNDKRVRSVAREIIERLTAEHRTGYTAHAYSQDEADSIVAAMRSAGRGSVTTSATALRERAASKGGAQ